MGLANGKERAQQISESLDASFRKLGNHSVTLLVDAEPQRAVTTTFSPSATSEMLMPQASASRRV